MAVVFGVSVLTLSHTSELKKPEVNLRWVVLIGFEGVLVLDFFASEARLKSLKTLGFFKNSFRKFISLKTRSEYLFKRWSAGSCAFKTEI